MYILDYSDLCVILGDWFPKFVFMRLYKNFRIFCDFIQIVES